MGDISFKERDWKGVFEPLRHAQRFAQVAVDGGTIVWPHDGLDMAPEPLYAGTCQQAHKPSISA